MTVEEAIALVERLLERGRLTRVQEIVFRQSWHGKTYLDIAKEVGYDAGHIKDTGAELWQLLSKAFGEKVTKQNLHGILKRTALQRDSVVSSPPPPSQPSTYCDWGDAIDVAIFYGRTEELTTLKQWITHDRCRLVTLLGMGGIGKTSLSVKLAEEIQGEFDCLIWRSLRDAPPIAELLVTLIQVLSQQQDTILPETVSGKLSHLIDVLRRSRCLVILDNFDAVLQGSQRAGTYRAGYEAYEELLKRVGEIAHQSCLVLTSREKPQEVGTQAGDRLPVRNLPLVGLDLAAGQHILDAKGLHGAVVDLEQLVTCYRGNPLALKMAATSVLDLFAGDIGQFLQQGTAVFNGIRQLLKQQCDRLIALEQAIMDWLAINREPVTLAELQAEFVTALSTTQLLEMLESLRWRSLIESSAIGFTQQPVVMEFVTESLIERMAAEIMAEQPQLFLSHALIKAQVKDYIRDSQIRVILQPLIDRLLTQLKSPQQLTQQLDRLLVHLRTNVTHQANYGAGNLLNLFRQLETNLTGYDFSGLSIQQAYLQDVTLHQVNFTGAEFVNCAFAATFGGVTSVTFSPDGEQLATSDTNGGIRIGRVTDGAQLAVCTGHTSWVWVVAYSPFQPMLASGGQDHQVRLWDSHTGQCLKLLEGHTAVCITNWHSSSSEQSSSSTSQKKTICCPGITV